MVVMTGEDFLRGWAAEIVAAGEMDWYQRFYSLVEVLQIVDAIDIDVARAVGQEIRSGLTAKTGEPTPDFHLYSHRPATLGLDDWQVPERRVLGKVSVRAAYTALPEAEGQGGTDFLTVDSDTAWLSCSGAGAPPWPEHRAQASPSGWLRAPQRSMQRASAAVPPFLDVIDDRGRHYTLAGDSSGASSSGTKRHRWDLRAEIAPPPGAEVTALEFVTAHGSMTATLRPPAPTTVDVVALNPPPSEIERHLTATVHDHVWYQLLDRDSWLEPIGMLAEALIAIGALDPEHPLAQAILAVDDALAGQAPAEAIPDALSAALRTDPRRASWLGVEALASPVDLDGATVILEAVVGHSDRMAVHFLEGLSSDPTATSAYELIVWATDDQGGGYAGHAEYVAGPEGGAYHLRPPHDPAATQLYLYLQGPRHRATVNIDLSRLG
jgi:hypothetical protein